MKEEPCKYTLIIRGQTLSFENKVGTDFAGTVNNSRGKKGDSMPSDMGIGEADTVIFLFRCQYTVSILKLSEVKSRFLRQKVLLLCH